MKVVIQQVDLDTCLTAFILKVSESDDITVKRGEADPADLSDPHVLCIEAGGSGQVVRNNFDHHNVSLEQGSPPPACRQAFNIKGGDDKLRRLVEYVEILDVDATRLPPARIFPTLSQVFSGMRLVYRRDPKRQLLEGLRILRRVLEDGLNPFGAMPSYPEWADYIRAKKAENEALEKVKKEAQIFTTRSGLKVGYLQTDFIGAPLALYNMGCHIAIAYSPSFGEPPVAKYTISGNGVRVDHLLPTLNALEAGWGGPSHGTIIGSPRMGSALSPARVIEIVIQGDEICG